MVTGLKIKRESGAKASSPCLSAAKEFIPSRQCKTSSEIWLRCEDDIWYNYRLYIDIDKMRDKWTPIISKSGTENQFVCRWGKSCLDHLPGIRCHSVTKCSAARTMNVNFWEPVWKHVSLVQRVGGGARVSVKVQQRLIASDIHGWPLSSNFLKLFPLCEKNSHTCSGYQTNCM